MVQSHISFGPRTQQSMLHLSIAAHSALEATRQMQANATACTISSVQPKTAPLRLLCQPTVLVMPPASSLRSPWHCKQKLRRNPSASKRRTEAQCKQSQRSPATSSPGCGRAPPRRAALLAAAFAGLAACSGSPEAAAAGLSAGEAAAVQRAAGVVPALPPSSYLRLIAAARPAALRALSAQVPCPGRLRMSPPCHALPGAIGPFCEPAACWTPAFVADLLTSCSACMT